MSIDQIPETLITKWENEVERIQQLINSPHMAEPQRNYYRGVLQGMELILSDVSPKFHKTYTRPSAPQR